MGRGPGCGSGCESGAAAAESASAGGCGAAVSCPAGVDAERDKRRGGASGRRRAHGLADRRGWSADADCVNLNLGLGLDRDLAVAGAGRGPDGELWAGDGQNLCAGAGPRGRDRQPSLPGHDRGWSVGGAECGCVRADPCGLHASDGHGRGFERSPGRLDQHWSADRAGGRDGSDSGRHRGPERCAGLLLWGRNPAFERRRKQLEPDDHNRGHEVELRRGGVCRVCLEHFESATGGGRGVAGL